MRGQAFTTFKLLIGAVLAVTLLMIALAINTQVIVPYTGLQTAKDLVAQAKKTPGECFSRENAIFKESEPFTTNIQALYPSTTVHEKPPLASGIITLDVTVPLTAKCAVSGSCEVWFNSADCP